MKSKLEIVPIEKSQSKIASAIRSLEGAGIYVSVNKNQKRIEALLKKSKIDVKNIFFIDCVSSDGDSRDVLQVSSFLIYNNKDQVAAFVRKITEYASSEGVEVVAFSAKTKGEELLNKIFGFFDEVKGK